MKNICSPKENYTTFVELKYISSSFNEVLIAC